MLSSNKAMLSSGLPSKLLDVDYRNTQTHCIVPPQLWTDMSCSWTGPLTLRWWHHSIYVAWPSVTYGILLFICHCFTSTQIASIRADHLWIKHTLGWSPWNLAIIHGSCDLGPTCGTYHWRIQWKGQTIGTLKETRCHSWKFVFKEFDSVRFNASSLLVLYTWI